MENKAFVRDLQSVTKTNLETILEHQKVRTKKQWPNPVQERILDQGWRLTMNMPEKVDNPKSDANKWDISTEREKIKRETLLVGEGDVA